MNIEKLFYHINNHKFVTARLIWLITVERYNSTEFHLDRTDFPVSCSHKLQFWLLMFKESNNVDNMNVGLDHWVETQYG